jgi:hypothetical protein
MNNRVPPICNQCNVEMSFVPTFAMIPVHELCTFRCQSCERVLNLAFLAESRGDVAR